MLQVVKRSNKSWACAGVCQYLARQIEPKSGDLREFTRFHEDSPVRNGSTIDGGRMHARNGTEGRYCVKHSGRVG